MPLAGSGTSADPYLIGSAADVAEFATLKGPHYQGAEYRVTADIDFGGSSLVPFDYFSGVFDGDGHVISNVVVDGTSVQYAGMFGRSMSGTISDLGMDAPSFVNLGGTAQWGGIVGWCYGGIVERCFSVGMTQAGGNYGGGLVGRLSHGGTVRDCYGDGLILDANTSGGVVARPTAPANQIDCWCFAQNANGTKLSVSGLGAGAITACYHVVAASPLYADFKGSYELLRADLTQGRLEAAGWDFASVWEIQSGADPVPVLQAFASGPPPDTDPPGAPTGLQVQMVVP